MNAILQRPIVKRILLFVTLALFLALVTVPARPHAKPWGGLQHPGLDVRALTFVAPPVVSPFAAPVVAPRPARLPLWGETPRDTDGVRPVFAYC